MYFKVMTVIASPGQGPDRSTEVSYTDTKEQYYIQLSLVIRLDYLTK